MTKKTLPKWDAERTANLVDMVGTEYEEEVSVSQVEDFATALETTTRSVAAKLRKMGYTVESTAKAHKKVFSDEQEAQIIEFVTDNNGMYTYAEIAQILFDTTDMARQVQGKILSLDLTENVKKTEVKVEPKKYTDEEEAKLAELISSGAFIEDIAEAMGREIKSIRGKALSMLKTHNIEMPKQRSTITKDNADALSALDNNEELTVEEIADSIGKTVRGVKTMLTHRGLNCSNYKGAKRAEKIAEKKAA